VTALRRISAVKCLHGDAEAVYTICMRPVPY